MAITQKHKVEFMVTAVLPSDVEQELAQDLVKLAKAVMNGETHFKGHPIDGRQKHMLTVFVTEGMEGIAAFLIRQAMREAIKEMREEYADGDCFKFSPASVRKVS